MAKKKAETPKKKTSKKKSVTESFKEDQLQEQMDLMDWLPENIGEIAKEARKYRQMVKDRISIGDKEVVQKAKLKGMILASNPTRNADGIIKFTCDGLTVSVTPRDELISVSESEKKKKSDAK